MDKASDEDVEGNAEQVTGHFKAMVESIKVYTP
jgi:hypothetical protein